MINCVYYSPYLRCFRDGRVERIHKYHLNKVWVEIPNIDNNKCYNQIKIENKKILRHRLIAFCFLGLENLEVNKEKSNTIDHRDQNKLNNAVANLRICDMKLQNQNKNCKGFSFHKARGKFMAQIQVNYKKIHLGCFTTAEEARQSYLSAKLKYHN